MMKADDPVVLLAQTHYRILTVLECIYQAAWFRGRPDYPNYDDVDPETEIAEAGRLLDKFSDSDFIADEDLWPFAAARSLAKSSSEPSAFEGTMFEPELHLFASYHEAALELAREGHKWLSGAQAEYYTAKEIQEFALTFSKLLDTKLIRGYRAQMNSEYAIVRSGRLGDFSNWNILKEIQQLSPNENVAKKRGYHTFTKACPTCKTGTLTVGTTKPTGVRYLYCDKCDHSEKAVHNKR